MKNNNKILNLILILSLVFSFISCEDEEKTFFQSIENGGGYLHTLEKSSDAFLISDLDASVFEVRIEAHDYTSDTSLLQSVDVFVSLNNDGNEALLINIAAAAFTNNSNGYPEYLISTTATNALTALSIDPLTVTSADLMYYRLVLHLSDGTSYTVGQINPDLVGETFFQSPFFYEVDFN